MTFVDGHWEYMGDGEELKVSRERKAVREVLWEENRPRRIRPFVISGHFMSCPDGMSQDMSSYLSDKSCIAVAWDFGTLATPEESRACGKRLLSQVSHCPKSCNSLKTCLIFRLDSGHLGKSVPKA